MKYYLSLEQTDKLKRSVWKKFCDFLDRKHPEHDFTFIEREDGSWMTVDLD